MSFWSRLLLPLVMSALLVFPAAAQQRDGEGAGIFSLLPADSTTEHVLSTGEAQLKYKATAGTLDLYGQDGAQTAKVFYTAYVADSSSPRPLTFVFNGGPGAASAYLHLGLAGPKILDFGPAGDNGTSPNLVDNPDSWLRFTDLVFLDPVGTGWSRAASNDIAGNFYGVDRDADSIAKLIALYVQKNGRLQSPKYLLGESYGGFRAAKVATALKNDQGILVSGIILLSPLLEGRFLFNSGNDPLSAALQLPSLAAAELQRRGEFTREALADAERFAMTNYLVALAGPPLPEDAAVPFYQKISRLTGIPEAAIAANRGFLADLYSKYSAGNGQIVSRYDAGYSRPDPYPEAVYARHDDPILDGYTRAYGGAFASYAKDHLGYDSPITYALLNEDVNRRWEWGGEHGQGGRATASVEDDLRDLLAVIPEFRVLVAHGYSDAITPFGMSRYVLNHLPPKLAEGRTELVLYQGGHMFYTDATSRKQFFEDVKAFYEEGVPK